MRVFHLSAKQLDSRLLKILEKPKTDNREKCIFLLKMALRIRIRELKNGEEIILGKWNMLVGKSHSWGTLLVSQAPYDGSIASLVDRLYE